MMAAVRQGIAVALLAVGCGRVGFQPTADARSRVADGNVDGIALHCTSDDFSAGTGSSWVAFGNASFTTSFANARLDISLTAPATLEQALTIDEPSIPSIDNDLVDSVAGTYGDADPDEVVDALETHANHLAELADTAGTANWSRGFTIGDDRIEVRRLLEHALHDSQHHLDDVERGLASL